MIKRCSKRRREQLMVVSAHDFVATLRLESLGHFPRTAFLPSFMSARKPCSNVDSALSSISTASVSRMPSSVSARSRAAMARATEQRPQSPQVVARHHVLFDHELRLIEDLGSHAEHLKAPPVTETYESRRVPRDASRKKALEATRRDRGHRRGLRLDDEKALEPDAWCVVDLYTLASDHQKTAATGRNLPRV